MFFFRERKFRRSKSFLYIEYKQTSQIADEKFHRNFSRILQEKRHRYNLQIFY